MRKTRLAALLAFALAITLGTGAWAQDNKAGGGGQVRASTQPKVTAIPLTESLVRFSSPLPLARTRQALIRPSCPLPRGAPDSFRDARRIY